MALVWQFLHIIVGTKALMQHLVGTKALMQHLFPPIASFKLPPIASFKLFWSLPLVALSFFPLRVIIPFIVFFVLSCGNTRFCLVRLGQLLLSSASITSQMVHVTSGLAISFSINYNTAIKLFIIIDSQVKFDFPMHLVIV